MPNMNVTVSLLMKNVIARLAENIQERMFVICLRAMKYSVCALPLFIIFTFIIILWLR